MYITAGMDHTAGTQQILMNKTNMCSETRYMGELAMFADLFAGARIYSNVLQRRFLGIEASRGLCHCEGEDS